MNDFARPAYATIVALLLGLMLSADRNVAAQTSTLIYGVSPLNNNTLVAFSSSDPSTIILNAPITGLQSGEIIQDIDFRPATGQLYALGNTNGTGRLYTINAGTSGAATLVAILSADPTDTTNPYTGLNGNVFTNVISIDFDPTTDSLRVVSDLDQNLRVNPLNGLVITDDPIAYAVGDSNAGRDAITKGIAYSNSVAGASATTLYNIDSNTSISNTGFLTIQNPPNNGTLNTVGPTGLNNPFPRGFDITTSPDGTTNTGYLTFANLVNGNSFLFSINLGTGAVTRIGATTIGNNSNINVFGIAIPPAARGLVISEFRFRGANGAADEFVEFYNPSDTDLTVLATDGSAGYALVGSDGALRFVIPNATVIPARGHFLGINFTGYSLFNYPSGNGTTATGDAIWSSAIPDNAGIALFSTTNPTNYTLANRLDAVGFSGVPSLYSEGGALQSPGANDGEYSFVRKTAGTGQPQDTQDNAADFVFVSTNGGTYGGVQSILGAPGPEERRSPVLRSAGLKASLIDPAAGASASPNRVRDTLPYADALTPSSPTGVTAGVPNSTYAGGTLSVQRRFTNTTGATVTRLRFRVVDITTLNSPGAGATQADVRWLTSNGVLRGPVGTTLQGITIEQPPTQQFGAALNSSGAVTLSGGGLAPGASVNVQFLLGVVQGGSYRYFIIVEALPASPGFAGSTKIVATKGTRVTKQ